MTYTEKTLRAEIEKVLGTNNYVGLNSANTSLVVMVNIAVMYLFQHDQKNELIRQALEDIQNGSFKFGAPKNVYAM